MVSRESGIRMARQFVLLFLEKGLPADVNDLLEFVEHRGGWRMPRALRSCQNARTLRSRGVSTGVCLGIDYTDNYEVCLQVLARVLVEGKHHGGREPHLPRL